MTTNAMQHALDDEFAIQGITVEDVPADTTPQDWFYPYLVDVAAVPSAEYEATVAAINDVLFAATEAPIIVADLIAAAPTDITHYGHVSVELRPLASRTNANGVTRRRAQSIVIHAFGW